MNFGEEALLDDFDGFQRETEKKLARFNATITVLEEESGSEFKDILVQVQEGGADVLIKTLKWEVERLVLIKTLKWEVERLWEWLKLLEHRQLPDR